MAAAHHRRVTQRTAALPHLSPSTATAVLVADARRQWSQQKKVVKKQLCVATPVESFENLVPAI